MPTDSRTARTVWLAGCVLLLVVMVAGGGWLAWRTTSTPVPAVASPATTPDDIAFGAPMLVDGVPWGWPATAKGAVAAAVTAVTVTGQPDVVFDPARFAAVAEVVFTPTQATTQAAQVDAARIRFELSGWDEQPDSRRMYHLAPLAARLVAFDPDRLEAQVEVWAMTLVGIGDSGGAVFTTSTIDLATDVDGSWQVTGLDSVQGPTPLTVETVSAPGRTRAAVSGAVPLLPLPLGVSP